MWIRFAAVIAFLRASEVPSVNTVTRGRGLAQTPVRGRARARYQLLSLAPWVPHGRGELVDKGWRHKQWGVLCPLGWGRGWLVVLNGQLPPHPSGCRWSGVRIGRGWGWWQGLAGVHRAQSALGLAWWWLPDS